MSAFCTLSGLQKTPLYTYQAVQQQLETLKEEKQALQEHLLNLKARISELEGQVGSD